MGEVSYARTADGTHIAYRVLDASAERSPGTCSDIVMASGGLFPMELFEDDPGFVRLLDGLRALGRVVVFDRRGLGLSDPIVDWERPLLDQWADDLAAVVEAAGVADVVLFTWDGHGIGTRYAARRPDRVRMLVLEHPLWVPAEAAPAWVAERLAIVRDNVEGRRQDFLAEIAPSRAAEPAFRDWYARAGRVGASPATAARIWEAVYRSSLDDQLLDEVVAPTLVLYRRDNWYAPSDVVRGAASKIAGAKVVALDGADHFPFVGDVDAVVAEISDFVFGERRLPPPQRLLAVVMFTDLVGSTERNASMGDARWKALLDRHDAVVRVAVGRCGGSVVKSTGDGVLALLPSAGVALAVAERVRDELAAEGLGVYIGIHIGDIDRRGDDVSGLAVNTAARAMAAAAPGEIMVTAPVRMATAGQAATFESAGMHEFKGVPGEWELFRLASQ